MQTWTNVFIFYMACGAVIYLFLKHTIERVTGKKFFDALFIPEELRPSVDLLYLFLYMVMWLPLLVYVIYNLYVKRNND